MEIMIFFIMIILFISAIAVVVIAWQNRSYKKEKAAWDHYRRQVVSIEQKKKLKRILAKQAMKK